MIINTKNILKASLIALAVFLASCDGKDGDPGPDGKNAANGTNGTNGSNGSNGVAYDGAVTLGNIKINLSGKRPKDNLAFSVDQDFKFAPSENSPANYSQVYTDSETGEKTFTLHRLLSVVDEHTHDNFITINITISSTGEIVNYYLYTNTTVVVGPKYFGVSEYTYSNYEESSIDNFSYDAATGKVKFNFVWTEVDSYSTGHMLTITGAADVIVLQKLNDVTNDYGG